MAPMALHTDERGSSLSWPDDSPGGTVLARTTRDRTVVELHGEIDLAVVLATTPQLYALTVASVPSLVADLRPVTFIDCSGLAMLVDVRSRVLSGGGEFTMVCADPKILRLLKITGLSALLAPVPALDEAPGDGHGGGHGGEQRAGHGGEQGAGHGGEQGAENGGEPGDAHGTGVGRET